MLHGIASGKQRRRLSAGSFSQQPEDTSTQGSKDALAAVSQGTTWDGSLLSSLLDFCRSKRPMRHAFAQEQSLFFSRLPLEIRLMIYHHVFDYTRVHIVPTYSKLVGVPCKLPEPGSECAIRDGDGIHGWVRYMRIGGGCCKRIHPDGPVSLSPDMAKGIKGALKLLGICGRVYVEAVSVLYGNQVFAVSQLVGLMGLSISIPPHRFASITRLEIDDLSWIDVHSDNYEDYIPSIRLAHLGPSRRTPDTPQDERVPGAWELICTEVLPRMTGLVELKISTEPYCPAADESRRIDRVILQPLRALTMPSIQVFEVRVVWHQWMVEPSAALSTQHEAEEQGWAIPYCFPFTLIKMV